MQNEFKVEAVFENGVFRPSQPVFLPAHQPVTLLIQVPNQDQVKDWPSDVKQIYNEIAAEDRRLAQSMVEGIASTWPANENLDE